MEKPVIASKNPVLAEVKKGETYWWCSCGRSKSQPFCDGSHEGTSFTPMEFPAKVNRTLKFCTCKHTKNPPYCDNAHLDLP